MDLSAAEHNCLPHNQVDFMNCNQLCACSVVRQQNEKNIIIN